MFWRDIPIGKYTLQKQAFTGKLRLFVPEKRATFDVEAFEADKFFDTVIEIRRMAGMPEDQDLLCRVLIVQFVSYVVDRNRESSKQFRDEPAREIAACHIRAMKLEKRIRM